MAPGSRNNYFILPFPIILSWCHSNNAAVCTYKQLRPSPANAPRETCPEPRPGTTPTPAAAAATVAPTKSKPPGSGAAATAAATDGALAFPAVDGLWALTTFACFPFLPLLVGDVG